MTSSQVLHATSMTSSKKPSYQNYSQHIFNLFSMVLVTLTFDVSPPIAEAFESNEFAKSNIAKYGSDLDNSIYQLSSSVHDSIPSFAGPIPNVTVNVGREAVLECPVNSLGHYKVGWLKAKDQTILALHNRVITHNGRIAVDHEESRIWKLKIRHVQESDRGCYMCQLNTAEMKKQIGCIDVLIPPDIDDRQTSSDVIVNEGDDADLVCKANGHPKPTIEWFREDKNLISVVDHKFNYSRRVTVDRYTGEILRLKKVQRQQMGAYLCIASNNVPPAVSKRIILNVNFAPEITVPSQLFGVAPGTDVTFSCQVQAYPPAINYWMKNESEMLLNGSPKYNISEVQVSTFERILYITISNWQKSDQSQFACISTNSLGKADGRIQSYTYVPKTEVEDNVHTFGPGKQRKMELTQDPPEFESQPSDENELHVDKTSADSAGIAGSSRSTGGKETSKREESSNRNNSGNSNNSKKNSNRNSSNNNQMSYFANSQPKSAQSSAFSWLIFNSIVTIFLWPLVSDFSP